MGVQYVSYLRCSTSKQEVSGLGLEAQRETVTRFAESRGGSILTEIVEVESGTKSDRPQLAAALSLAKRVGATLLIAKLDRLARSVALVSALMEAKVEFTACDFPDANRFLLHLMAAVAEHEREMISARTKAALAAAKARGVKLGTFSQILAVRRIEEAERYARSIEIPVKDIIASGARTVREIAAALNERGIPAPAGGAWWPSSAGKLLQRLQVGTRKSGSSRPCQTTREVMSDVNLPAARRPQHPAAEPLATVGGAADLCKRYDSSPSRRQASCIQTSNAIASAFQPEAY